MIRLTRTLTTLFVFGAIAFKELYRVRSSPDWASKLDELKQLELNVGPSADPSVGLLRATVLCAAILDGMDKGLARERAILLIEKADEEAWPTAWLLANHELIPGIGKIRIPSYFAPQEPTIPEAEPLLKTPFAQALWAQRKKIEAEGLKRLDRDEVDAEVALRRGRPLV